MDGNTGRSPFNDQVKQAIDWEVLLSSGDATEAELRHFHAWLAEKESNAAAWASLQRKLNPLKALDGKAAGAASAALRSPGPKRRALLKTGTALGLIALTGIGTRHLVHRYGLDADYRTASNMQQVALSQSVQMTVGAGTRVYTVSRVDGRSVRMERGQIALEQTRNTAAPSSLTIATPQGTITTRGHAISVDLFDTHGVMSTKGAGALIRVPGRGEQQVADGSTWRFGENGFRRLPESAEDIFAWTDGIIVVEDRPVSDVIDDLRRHRAGVVYFPPEALQRRVSGVFPLNDIDGSLRQVADTLHLNLSFYGAYLVVAT